MSKRDMFGVMDAHLAARLVDADGWTPTPDDTTLLDTFHDGATRVLLETQGV